MLFSLLQISYDFIIAFLNHSNFEFFIEAYFTGHSLENILLFKSLVGLEGSDQILELLYIVWNKLGNYLFDIKIDPHNKVVHEGSERLSKHKRGLVEIVNYLGGSLKKLFLFLYLGVGLGFVLLDHFIDIVHNLHLLSVSGLFLFQLLFKLDYLLLQSEYLISWLVTNKWVLLQIHYKLKKLILFEMKVLFGLGSGLFIERAEYLFGLFWLFSF